MKLHPPPAESAGGPDPELDEPLDETPAAVETFGDGVIPHCGMEDDEVAALDVPYTSRASTDWVVSGPLVEGWCRGRYFESWEDAERWARVKYGNKYRGRVQEAGQYGHRWAFVIKRLEVN